MVVIDRLRRRDPDEMFESGTHRPEAPIAHVVGLSLLFLVPGLLFAFFIEWGSSSSHDEWSLLLPAAVCVVLGGALAMGTWVGRNISPAQVFSAVAFSWLASSLIGALPYVMGSMFPWDQFDDAIFESVSGFSTSGSTVLPLIEHPSNGSGILMWRQLTQWYGGMGMVVLAVTVLPFLGVGGLALMSAEAPGPTSERLMPRVSETARLLWGIYAGGTVLIAAILFAIPGPGLYDSVAHALATASTGGFSPRDASIGHFDSVLVEAVIIVALVWFAVNFTLHHVALRGEPRAYLKDSNTRVFVSMLAIATVLVTLLNWGSDVVGPSGEHLDTSFGPSLRTAVFNVASLGTSTGFGNAQGGDSMGNFVLWAAAPQIVLLFLMAVGGNTGSTAGGCKVFRMQVGIGHLIRQMRRLRHPNGIIPVKQGRNVVADEIVSRVLGFLALFFGLCVAGTLIVTAFGSPLLESASGVLSAMSNMGPAMGETGPTSNFTFFARPARMVIAMFMIIGRLEIFAVMLMFVAPMQSVRRRLAR